MTPGQRFRVALKGESPLQIVGVINAYCALMAEHAGHKALYVSGAGVANASYAMPDLGLTTLENVCEDVRRICAATSRPVLVDIDTGFDDPGATVVAMIEVGAGGVHLEDQVVDKRCGHREGKQLVSLEEMGERVKAAVEAGKRHDPEFMVMARTDAVAVEGLDAALNRALAYQAAGADAIFAEAISELEDYRRFSEALSIPVLANLTEFGKTPLYSLAQLREVGVAMALYPLTAFRAMSHAAQQVYQTLREQGSQATLLDQMQTREQLYAFLDYERYEQQQRR